MLDRELWNLPNFLLVGFVAVVLMITVHLAARGLASKGL